MRAYEITRQLDSDVIAASVAWSLTESALEGQQTPQALADALVQRGEPQFTSTLLESLITQWIIADPDDAVPWMLNNQTYVNADSWPRLSRSVVTRDIAIAVELVERVPREFQGEWLAGVAFWYGQMDAEGALDWITEYESHPSYGDVLTRVVAFAGVMNPQFLVDFVETSDAAVGRDAIQMAANYLTQADPYDAVQWATGLVDAERSAMAMEGVVSSWLVTDPAAVQRWTLDQPRSQSRDRILDALMLEGVLSADLDRESLLDAYASDSAAQQIIAASIERGARTPARFRETSMPQFELMIERLTDPELRQQAELNIGAAGM